jgi:RNA polymerase sigma-70 factor, ECF subfamily
MASNPRDQARPWDSPGSFSELVAPLHDPLIALARRILRSDDLARDAVQEAMLSLWLEAEVPPNPRAWLVRAVVNRSLHLLRSRARRRRHEGRACLEHSEASLEDDPARRFEGEDILITVQEAFTAIAPEFRDVLVLRAVEQMDYESIATTLKIPVGTVRSRLNRSRKALRDILRRTLLGDVHERSARAQDEEECRNGRDNASASASLDREAGSDPHA